LLEDVVELLEGVWGSREFKEVRELKQRERPAYSPNALIYTVPLPY
jgi:hypothetical protein